MDTGTTLTVTTASDSTAETGSSFLSFIQSPVFPITLIAIAIMVLLCILVNKLTRYYLKKFPQSGQTRKTIKGHTVPIRLISNIIKGCIILSGAITILQINGINVTSLITGVGIISVIIGLALQDVFKDIIMGLYIMADVYYEIGDVVKYGDFLGEVTMLKIRSTRLRNIENGNTITISNRNISEMVKVSPQHDINIGLSYDEDVRKVHEVMKDICEEINQADGINNCIYKGTQDYKDSCILYKIRLFCDPKNSPEMHRVAMRIIQDNLDRAGIKIPYNQLDIHQK